MSPLPYANGPTHHVTKMAVEQLIMVETGSYNPMYHRPYQTHLDAGSLNTILNRVDQLGTASVSGHVLAGVASNILAPVASVDPSLEVAIPHGWSERRIRFVLKLNAQYSIGSEVVYYIQGYTNYPGVTLQGHIDPHMSFIINSVVAVGKAVVNYDAMGYSSVDRMLESYQVVADPTWQSITQQSQSHLMRPQDVFSGMQSNYLRGAVDQFTPHGGPSYHDSRTTLRSDPQRSNRGNNLPAQYLARVVDGFYYGAQMADFGYGNADVLSKSREQVMEAPISENPFIRWLGERHQQAAGYQFTFAELEELDYNARNMVNFIVNGPTQQAAQHHAGLTSYWTGSDRPTVVATSLMQAIPALMMDLLISKIILRSTNYDIGGQMSTVLIDAKSLTGIDMRNYYDRFIRRLEQEVIQDFTFNNQEMYQLEIRADIFGETWISLSLAGQPAIQYVAPSFCDNLFTPVIAQNQLQFDALVLDMERLVNNVNDTVAHYRQAPQGINPYI